MGRWASGGIALANSISYSIQAFVLILLLSRQLPDKFKLGGTFIRGIISATAAGLSAWLIFFVLPIPLSVLLISLCAMGVAGLIGMVPIWQEIRLLTHL
jgi:peptidoglycan biosynthesis protein MviN/MurJ (putative lipid II flippase)